MTEVMGHDTASEIVVDRIPAPSQVDFERKYRRASQPVILTDVVPTWGAFGRWSHTYFRESWGQHPILVIPTRGRHGQYDAQKGYVLPEMRMAEALDRIERGGPESVYAMVPLDRYLDGLLGEVDVPIYCQGRPGFRSRLWVSAPDIGVRLHREFSENLIAQVDGVKEIIMYPPEEWHRLYAFPRRSPVPTFCLVEGGEDPAAAGVPRYADARRAVVTLRAGEMLFLPSRWWHHSRTVESSVTITFWWAAGVYEKMIRVARRIGLTANI